MSRSPPQKASLELSQGNKLTDKNQAKRKQRLPIPVDKHLPEDVCAHESCSMWLLPGHVPGSLDLVWMSASLPTGVQVQAARLSTVLTTPLPRQLHYSCKHTAVTSTECVGWALRTLPSCQTGREGSALSPSLLRLGDFIGPGLGILTSCSPSQTNATFHELPRSSAPSEGVDCFGLKTWCSTEVFPQPTQVLRL